MHGRTVYLCRAHCPDQSRDRRQLLPDELGSEREETPGTTTGAVSATSAATATNSAYNGGAWASEGGQNTSYGPPNFEYSVVSGTSGTAFITAYAGADVRNNYGGWVGTQLTVGSSNLTRHGSRQTLPGGQLRHAHGRVRERFERAGGYGRFGGREYGRMHAGAVCLRHPRDADHLTGWCQL
jgi:hypothetical protein